MGALLCAVTGLHLLVLLLLFLVTLDKGWWVLPAGQELNLWLDCVQNGTRGWACARLGPGGALRGAQALLGGGLLLSAASLLLFLGQLHGGARGGPFSAAGGAQILAGLAVLAGAGLYVAVGGAGALGGAWLPPGGGFGRCPPLAGVGGVLALLSGATYLRLRKVA